MEESESTRRRNDGDTNSPEFEFWMVRNPSFPQPDLMSADELFSDGLLLPLQVLHLSSDAPTAENGEVSGSTGLSSKPESSSSVDESAKLSASSSSFTSSKRWRDLFKKNEKKKNTEINGDDAKGKEVNNNCVKEKKREKKSNGAGNGVSAAELNINIWPFSRSRSAGNGRTRPRSSVATTRKVSSAPCSRSNSGGESKSRKWPPASPGRGVPVGRSSPVWQVRRNGGNRISESVIPVKKEMNSSRRMTSSGGKVLRLNVPTCIGYGHNLSCRSDGNGSGEGVRGSHLFNLRSLFTKKVY